MLAISSRGSNGALRLAAGLIDVDTALYQPRWFMGKFLSLRLRVTVFYRISCAGPLRLTFRMSTAQFPDNFAGALR
jgi:hypothetical protein